MHITFVNIKNTSLYIMLSEANTKDTIKSILDSQARELFSYINRQIIGHLHYVTTIHIGTEIIPIEKYRLPYFDSNNFIYYLLMENLDGLNNILKKIGGFKMISHQHLHNGKIEKTFLNIEPINFCDYIYTPLYQCFAQEILKDTITLI